MANAKLTLHVPHITTSNSSADADKTTPSIFGLPLKYVSLVTLAVQNALLTIIMHYSRVSTPPDKAYSAASAVLLNELLKCGISLLIALTRLDNSASSPSKPSPSPFAFSTIVSRSRKLSSEVFSPDCWKLSIPAILYVIQNNLQFVAAANLDVATFQVTYQMKILTTAGFSVLMLRKKVSPAKWLALGLLALGVGIVQIQAIGNGGGHKDTGLHTMYPLIGFLAVTAACFTSGLAGVYFEKVLKTSQADLWVRNVQLSLFSLIPALVPVFFASSPSKPDPAATTFLASIFKNFGLWAWATVLTQVFGGLITAVVIKYSDNILKGFATSLAIVLSSVSSVFLFGFAITPGFMVGASVVLGSTWLYNQPDKKPARRVTEAAERRAGSSYPGSPVENDAPIIGLTAPRRTSSSTALFQSLGLASSSSSLSLAPEQDKMGISATSAFASLKGSRESINPQFTLNGISSTASTPYNGTPWGGNTPHRGPSPAPGAGPNGTVNGVVNGGIPLVPLTVNGNGSASVNGAAGAGGYFAVPDPSTRKGDGSPPGRMHSHGGSGSGNGSPTGYGSSI